MQELIQEWSLRETLSTQSWLDFAEIVDRIESKQKRLKSPHDQKPINWTNSNEFSYLSKSWKTGFSITLLWTTLLRNLFMALSKTVLWSSDALLKSTVPGLGTRKISCGATLWVGVVSRFDWVKTVKHKLKSYFRWIDNVFKVWCGVRFYFWSCSNTCMYKKLIFFLRDNIDEAIKRHGSQKNNLKVQWRSQWYLTTYFYVHAHIVFVLFSNLTWEQKYH
jgi:hypothetical protein